MKKKNEILRLKEMVKKDRFNVGDEFYNLLIFDLNKLLREYFDYKDGAIVNLSKINDGYKLSIDLLVSNIKIFAKIP